MKRLGFVLALTAMALCASAANASSISWQTNTQLSGDTDVIAPGTAGPAGFQNYTLNNATNVDGSSVTVNGTAFTGAGETDLGLGNGNQIIQGNLTVTVAGGLTPAGGAYGATPNAPFTALSANYQNVLGTGDYQDSGNTESVVYSGLTPGDAYEFQFFVNDSRGGFGGRNETLSSNADLSAGQNTGSYDTGNASGALGNYVIGTFIADGTTSQTIYIGGGGSFGTSNLQNNAFVLLDAAPSVPEPASVVLFCLGAVGLLAAARRYRKA
jgi:hypothetical protein